MLRLVVGGLGVDIRIGSCIVRAFAGAESLQGRMIRQLES